MLSYHITLMKNPKSQNDSNFLYPTKKQTPDFLFKVKKKLDK
jgi:hypothetical protein